MSWDEALRGEGYHRRYRHIVVPFDLRPAVSKKRSDDEEGEDGEATSDGLTLRGLGTPFNSPTRIYEFWEEFDEQFAPGSFKRTIGIGGQHMLFDHGHNPVTGTIPIADITRLEESERGLEVTARMFNNWMTEPIRDAIRAGAINGMSIRFRPVHEEILQREDDVPLVTVVEAELAEVGPVLNPAYRDTEVSLRFDPDRPVEDPPVGRGGSSSGANEGSNQASPVRHLAYNHKRLRLLEL